jgi:hypothetical protein
MKKLFIISVFLISQILSAQYPVTIGTKRYISQVANGTDITHTIETAVTASSDGDVIVLPKGKFVIHGQITITDKYISLIGRGADSTTGTMLYRLRAEEVNSLPMFYWYYTAPQVTSSYYFVSGIYFKGVPGTLYGGSAIGATYHSGGIKFQKTSNWIVSDNVFQYLGTSGVEVRPIDSIPDYYGLIFNNRFLDMYQIELGNLGYGISVIAAYSLTHTWITDPLFGSNKFVFVEDNYFKQTRHSIAAGVCGKYVFRYNFIQDDWAATAIDMHGAGLYGNDLSTRATEIYNNTVTTTIDNYGVPITPTTSYTQYGVAIGIRGGESLIHNNIISNYKNGVNFEIEDTTYGGGTYPAPYQIGYLSAMKYGSGDTGILTDHGNGDAFIWDNTFNKKFTQFEEFVVNIWFKNWLKFNRDMDTVVKPSYTAYTYPHPYRNYYYTFIDNWLDSISGVSVGNIYGKEAVISWNDVIADSGYNIYLSTDGVNYSLKDSTTLNIVSKKITGLIFSTNYWVYVKAKNGSHEGNPSNINTFTTGIGTPATITRNGKSTTKNGKSVITIR